MEEEVEQVAAALHNCWDSYPAKFPWSQVSEGPYKDLILHRAAEALKDGTWFQTVMSRIVWHQQKQREWAEKTQYTDAMLQKAFASVQYPGTTQIKLIKTTSLNDY
jgi:hypothetical protein